MLEHTLINLNADISILQRHIALNQSTGLTNMLRLLESMSIALFRATHGYDLKNKNLEIANYPAVDLVDDQKRVAIQVTSNADAKKVKHTIKQFEKYGLSKDYDKLIIFGFLKQTRSANLLTRCEVIGVEELIARIMDKNDESIVQCVADAIRQHIDYTKLHPYDDKNCLSIVLHCIDRSAIKHRMLCEGSHSDMMRGLNEVTELISKGTINGKARNKSLEMYSDLTIQQFLIDIRHEISKIGAIVNQHRTHSQDMVFIPQVDFQKIDKIKKRIISLANKAAKYAELGIKLNIV